jgi:hypothetical protein
MDVELQKRVIVDLLEQVEELKAENDTARSMSKIVVLDTHIHLAKGWQDGSGLSNGWIPEEAASFHRDWTEDDLRALAAASEGFDVKGFVFVECCNEPPLEEAKWTLKMCEDPSSMIRAVTAHIPVPDGGPAVKAFLDELRDGSGALPTALKGGRVVICGQTKDACLDSKFTEGLEQLNREGGLLWEWCCFPEALPAITQVIASFPLMSRSLSLTLSAMSTNMSTN